MKLENLTITISKEDVFRQIGCQRESDLYEEFSEEYEEILEKMYRLCEPVCLIEYSDLKDQTLIEPEEGNKGAYLVLYSIGRKISEFSTKCFQEGDYVKGMLSDAMADSALLSMEKSIEVQVRILCEQMQVGICKRLEAPYDLPMEFQTYVFDKTRANDEFGFEISTGYMFSPIKSNAIALLLNEELEQFAFGHDCRKCKNYTCKHRKVCDLKVEAIIDGESLSLVNKDGESILELLGRYEKSFSAICGGTGKCAKCKIKVIKGKLQESELDRKCLTKEEIKEGIRLACKAYPTEQITFEVLFKKENDFQIISEYETSVTEPKDLMERRYGIAIDIGTTTIAMQLVDVESMCAVKTHTTINHQRKYGADVISRIKASVDGKKEMLRQSVISDLLTGIEELITDRNGCVKEIVLSGNTTMIHLLMGYNCKGLGEYPFVPENIAYIEDSFEKIFQSKLLAATVKIFPGISAFVGGDIVSGLYSCDIIKDKQYSLYIDLGTNGEIALGNREKIFVTSTAAGPAFEGGNISCGVGSIQGAISNVSIQNGRIQVSTIGNKEPIGICGTGAIETVAELFKENMVDETGYLDDEWHDKGVLLAKSITGEKIVFTQQDIRELQLAKAAIRAGIETLFLRYGVSKEQVFKVYIAGGFGYKLNYQKAIEIGMIPPIFSDRIEAVGNASLKGAVRKLLDKGGKEHIQYIKSISSEINLSADKDFNQFYMEYMYF